MSSDGSQNWAGQNWDNPGKKTTGVAATVNLPLSYFFSGCSCSEAPTILRSSKKLLKPSQRSAVADSLFVQSESQIWKSMALERRHLEQRRRRRRHPGREILRNWVQGMKPLPPPHAGVYLLLKYLSITPSFDWSFQALIIFATSPPLITSQAKCPLSRSSPSCGLPFLPLLPVSVLLCSKQRFPPPPSPSIFHVIP